MARPAFTFAEVLLCLMVLATSLTLLGGQQTKSVFRSMRSRQEIERLYPLKHYLYTAAVQPPSLEKPVLEPIKEPATKIELTQIPLAKKSPLAHLAGRILLVSAQGRWDSGVKRERELRLVTCVYTEPDIEEKK